MIMNVWGFFLSRNGNLESLWKFATSSSTFMIINVGFCPTRRVNDLDFDLSKARIAIIVCFLLIVPHLNQVRNMVLIRRTGCLLRSRRRFLIWIVY